MEIKKYVYEGVSYVLLTPFVSYTIHRLHFQDLPFCVLYENDIFVDNIFQCNPYKNSF